MTNITLRKRHSSRFRLLVSRSRNCHFETVRSILFGLDISKFVESRSTSCFTLHISHQLLREYAINSSLAFGRDGHSGLLNLNWYEHVRRGVSPLRQLNQGAHSGIVS